MGYSVHRVCLVGTLALSKRLLVSTLTSYSVHSLLIGQLLVSTLESYSVHPLLIGPDHYLSSPALASSLQSQARPAIAAREEL
jgi:hypothetical protein